MNVNNRAYCQLSMLYDKVKMIALKCFVVEAIWKSLVYEYALGNIHKKEYSDTNKRMNPDKYLSY